ncbi:MAG TPA: hypothetical protein VJ947_07560 [Pseudohaliea sp.]|nr:hypothetical protein [Pseudohaliea sp.]
MLISLHLPKTAGTSFLALLETVYGDALLRDYRDRPINRTVATRRLRAVNGCLRHVLPPPRVRTARCIHGHFLPLKYALLPTRDGRRFVVWLRDPVERLASHYHYWHRSYNPLDAGRLHRRVVEERWSLERFCLGPELRDIYSAFLWGFPLSRFDFVGITEHYDEDVAEFSARFLAGASPALEPRNVNAAQQPGGRDPYIEDPGFRAEVEAWHALDVALYREALAMRAARRA